MCCCYLKKLYSHLACRKKGEFLNGSKFKKNKGKTSTRKKPFIIDFHGHIVNPEVFEITQKNSLHSRIGLGKQTSLGGNKHSELTMHRMLDMPHRLRNMNKMGIDMQVISPSLIHHNTEPMAPLRALEIVQKLMTA